MNKVYTTAAEALDGVLFDGMFIAAGGFGLCGIPELLIAAIRDAGTKDITIASNNCGVDDFGLGVLLKTKQIRKMLLIAYIFKKLRTALIPVAWTKDYRWVDHHCAQAFFLSTEYFKFCQVL
jgi:acyl CoA:acetate/3-ketoacid CoA transferase alpha subunit